MRRAKRPKTSGPSMADEYQIWEFVYENLCQRQQFNDADESLFRQYLLNNPDKKWSITELMDYFNTSMLPSLYKCDLPAETVLGLYKALDIEITPHVEMKLEEMFNATVRLDSDRCIYSFKLSSLASSKRERAPVATLASPVATLPPASSAPLAPPGGGPPAIPEEERSQNQLVPSLDHDLEKRMWKHIFDKYDDLSTEEPLSTDFWQEMSSGQVDMPSASELLLFFCSKLREKLFLQRVEVEKRLRLYQILNCMVSQEAREWFLDVDKTRVQLDSRGHITSWEAEPKEEKATANIQNIAETIHDATTVSSTSNSASLPTKSSRASRAPKAEQCASDDSDDDFSGIRPTSALSSASSRPSSSMSTGSRKRASFTETEQLHAWTYIYTEIQKSIQQETERVLPKGKLFWKVYVEKTDSTRTPVNWSSHFRKRMCATLHEMKLPCEQILFLYKHIDIEVSEQAQKILERKFEVKLRIGHERQLVNWRTLHEDEEDEDQKEESIVLLNS